MEEENLRARVPSFLPPSSPMRIFRPFPLDLAEKIVGIAASDDRTLKTAVSLALVSKLVQSW